MEEVALRQNKTGTMYELERLPQNRFSGFRKQAQEQFYDMLTCKLIELLCEKMLSVPAMREVLLISHLSRKFLSSIHQNLFSSIDFNYLKLAFLLRS